MTNTKDLEKVTVADLLLQIQDAQNKIQVAQQQIAETLQTIQALQAQEAQQVEQAEEPKQLSQGEYLQKGYDAYSKGGGDETSDEIRKLAKDLYDLEKKITALGDCKVELDGYNRAKHLRSLANDMGELWDYVEDCIYKEKFEEVEKKIEWVESGRYKSDWLCIPENMEKARGLKAQYEEAIKDWESRYGDSSRILGGSFIFGEGQGA